MIVLGLTSDFHDSSAALIKNGEVLASANEERFTRNKHDSSFPNYAIDFCLNQTGLSNEDIDHVAYYEKPVKKWLRVLESSVAEWPRRPKDFCEIQSVWLGKKLWRKASIAKKLDISPNKISQVGHHLSHVYQAINGSGFKSSAVLTVDAVGETTTASMARYQNGRVEILSQKEYPNSLGLFYSAMTAFLGFKPMNDECTVMALAAFGEPTYVESLRKVIQHEEDGFWSIDSQYLQFDNYLDRPWTEKLTDLIGEPRDSQQNLNFSSTKETLVPAEQQHWADLACSVQLVFEEAMLHSCKKLREISGENNLCLAGGAALNCLSNTRILKESGFNDLYIPLDPSDGGAAIGAAMHVTLGLDSATSFEQKQKIALGSEGNDLAPMLEHLDVEHLQEYQKLGARVDTRQWNWQTIDQEEDLAEEIANCLANNLVVAFFQGRFEQGPRALGQRSILFRPDNLNLAEKVSQQIKERAPFRPYALSMTADQARSVLNIDSIDQESSPLKYMQLAVPVKDEWSEKVRAGLHIDNTTRPQIIDRTESPLFWQVASRFEKQSGIPAIINTSMNESGLPLVSSSEQALHYFTRTPIDVLVVNNLMIQKVER